MNKILAVIMILLAMVCVAQEYKVIQKTEDGRYYLDEQTVLLIANYIKQLEELNQNYKLQISNLEQQVENLKKQLLYWQQTVEAEQKEKQRLEEEIKKLQAAKNAAWVVTAVVAIGTVVLLFVQAF